MSNLSNQYISSSFQSLLNLQGQGSGLTVNLQTVQDGVGVSSPLKLSTTTVVISGSLLTSGSVNVSGSLVQHDGNIDISNSSIVVNSGLNNFQVANVGNAFIKSNGANPFILEGLSSIDNNSISFPLPLNISSSVKISGSLDIEGQTTFKGNLIPSGNYVYDLGAPTNNWRHIYVGSGSIYMDDHRVMGLDPINSDLQILAPTGTSIQLVDYTKSNSGLEVTSSLKVDFTGNTGNPLVDISNTTFDLFPNQHVDLRLFTQGNGNITFDAGGSNPRNDIGVNGRIIQYEPGSTPNSLKDTNITGSLRSSNIIGTGSLYLQPDQGDARFLEIYNTSPTDTHITASGGQIYLGNDVTYVKVDNYGSVNRIDVVAGNELVVSSSIINLSGSLYQSGTFYPDIINWVDSSIVQNTGSYVLTVNTEGVTQYDTYANIAGALSPYINSNRDGLITTGSVGLIQPITGSLNLTSIDNTTITTSEGDVSLDGGSNIFYTNAPGPVLGYFFANNITGVTVNGPGVSNAIVTEYGNSGDPNNYGTATLSSGTVSSGQSYTFTGPYPTPLSIIADKLNITGSVYSSNGYYSPAGLTLQNADGSGGQYPNININVDSSTYEGNIYAGLNINDASGKDGGKFIMTTYGPYNDNVPIIGGGGQYNGDDTAIGFYSGSIDMWKPTRFRALITGSLTISGKTTMSNSTNFPLQVNGTIQSQRFSFVGNPFNTNTGSVFGSLNYEGSNTTLQYANSDFGTPGTASYVYLTTQTGSNTTSTTVGAGYAGTTAQTTITNNNGVRSFNVQVDSTSITGSLNVTGSLKVSGNIQFASGSNKTMGSVALNGGNPGTATVSNSLVTTSSLIFLTKQTNTNSGNGTVSVTSKGSGTFSITSDHNGDSDVVAYQIINPA